MKKLFLLLSILMPMACLSAGKHASEVAKLRWGTFNIRLQTPVDDKEGLGWDVRRDRVAKYIKKKHLDVVGLQEVLHAQLEDLLTRLPEYDYVGVGRTDGMTKGEYSPVFFRKDKFEVLEKGNFWLSETPDVAGSVGWDAALERIASYAKLKDKRTGKVFMAVNTHFDHVGVKARRESAKLIMRKIQEIVGDRPAVVTGDFNVTEDDEAYVTMTTNAFRMNDDYHITAKHTGANYTWHQFCKLPPEKREKIDFIFLTPTIQVKRTHIEEPNTEAMLSDHNPHWADLEF
ncbi:MAG: endonuclease/exonuclease/phosphatase family protein [Bacteroidaceae bacterium]|nr:endonuclease/exonuclease/phosphatase family protein [Bacteroidaceae bacterium]MBR4516720.1 endonuclease/exonuclease/phosphatase family protein [Bacteroidaceae bacterium]